MSGDACTAAWMSKPARSQSDGVNSRWERARPRLRPCPAGRTRWTRCRFCCRRFANGPLRAGSSLIVDQHDAADGFRAGRVERGREGHAVFRRQRQGERGIGSGRGIARATCGKTEREAHEGQRQQPLGSVSTHVVHFRKTPGHTRRPAAHPRPNTLASFMARLISPWIFSLPRRNAVCPLVRPLMISIHVAASWSTMFKVSAFPSATATPPLANVACHLPRCRR